MLVKYNKCDSPAYRDDFFNDMVSQRYYGRGFASVPAVNIIEENDSFRIDVAAAGLSKKDFRINVENDLLTVSAEKNENEKEDRKDLYTRREFNYTNFSRSFRLDETIDKEGIKAKHADGILTIRLPKKETAIEKGPKQIDIA